MSACLAEFIFGVRDMACGRPVQTGGCVVLLVVWASVLAGCGGGTSSNNGVGGGNGTPPVTLTLSATPASPLILPGSGFTVEVMGTEAGTTSTPELTLGTMPAGLTSPDTFPMSVPAAGATVHLVSAASMQAGSYTLPMTAVAGSATAQTAVSLTVTTILPSQPLFVMPPSNEISIAQGSSASQQVTLDVGIQNPVIYSIDMSFTGLPTGVTATFNPQELETGGVFTFTLTASNNAPLAQNVAITLTGTPAASLPPATETFLLDVVPAAASGLSNRTDYVSERATPFGAVYDPAHQLIFASNPIWDRVDVISGKSHTLLKSLPVRGSSGMDLSVDGTKVWVAGESQVVYAIDTSTLAISQYQLPRLGAGGSSIGQSWEGILPLSLADGTLLISSMPTVGVAIFDVAIWNPVTNALTQLNATDSGSSYASWGALARSGDGKTVFNLGGDANETSFTYNVLTGQFSKAVQLAGFGLAIAANQDGSRLAATDFGAGFTLYDGSFNRIATLPGDGGQGRFQAANNFPLGGFTFSTDGKTLYEETLIGSIPMILTIDVASHQLLGEAPAMPVIPVFVQLSPPFMIPIPFGADPTGLVLGMQYHGIAFDDSTAYQNFVAKQAGSPTFMQNVMPYSGPLAGGTTSAEPGNIFSMLPSVYYGSMVGTASLLNNMVSITSPPATAPGTVNVKMLFPDGNEVFGPELFTYGTVLQDAILSGASPQGGVPGKLDGFGLPDDPSQDAVTIGGARATVTSVPTQIPPVTGEQTSYFLSYTVPPGVPGWTDISVTTPNGTGTLPKSFFYAKSVTDYALSDTPTYVLYDEKRNQVYLSAGDHIDVFSFASNSFVTPLQPPAQGAKKQFEGLALTPDGSTLVAADLLDNSIAVINPDNAATAFAIAVPPQTVNICPVGPLFVATDNLQHVYVNDGEQVAVGCGPGGSTFQVNLSSKMAIEMKTLQGCSGYGGGVSASGDGTMVAFGGGSSIYTFLPAQNRCLPSSFTLMPYGLTSAADGNVIGLGNIFASAQGNIIGRMALPGNFYTSIAAYNEDSPLSAGALQEPAMNASGSLYFWAYPNSVDIVDVQQGMTKLRFSLSETVSNTVAPLAVDGSGQRIFLITDKGLTVVDLGAAPLSIGHLSVTGASVGAQVTVRGSGFESGISASVGGTLALATWTDANTLTFTVPAVSKGLQDLLLTNPDGTSYTLNSALAVQ